MKWILLQQGGSRVLIMRLLHPPANIRIEGFKVLQKNILEISTQLRYMKTLFIFPTAADVVGQLSLWSHNARDTAAYHMSNHRC